MSYLLKFLGEKKKDKAFEKYFSFQLFPRHLQYRVFTLVDLNNLPDEFESVFLKFK